MELTDANVAFITGICGQVGSYIADYLLDKGYEVHGLIRRQRNPQFENINHIESQLHLHDGDLQDAGLLTKLLAEIQPSELYQMAAQSFVQHSFASPNYTFQVNTIGNLNVLEAIRHSSPRTRMYFAATSELFGDPQTPKQDESTPFNPKSPYGVSKLAAFHSNKNYREAYDLYIVNGICFNVESPRRSSNFVTKKIATAAARGEKVVLGNLDARRDWGYAPDYVPAMHAMLQLDKPEEFILATGETHTVREFAERAYKLARLDWKEYVTTDASNLRPNEVTYLCGDASKAKRVLNWEPKLKFPSLVSRLVGAEFEKSVAP